MNKYSRNATDSSVLSLPFLGRNFLTVSQLDAATFASLLQLARDCRDFRVSPDTLANKNVALMFEKPSLRTRVTFEVAIRQLGGWPIILGAAESRLGERESVNDVARNLSLWVNAIVARVFSHQKLEDLAAAATIPVVNALSDMEHPSQVIADILTLTDAWGSVEGRQLVYVGDWNNVSRSLARACALADLNFRAVCPPGYGPSDEESVEWSTEIDAVEGADAIYTDVWASMGQEDELQQRTEAFRSYQVSDQLMARTGKPAYFMHCLPAHRGLEVTDSVMDSGNSLVFHQAANRLPVGKAILISVVEGNYEEANKEGGPGVFGRPGHLHHHPVAQGKLWV